MNPVLGSLKPILKIQKNVQTIEEKVKELAPEIAKEELEMPKWDAPVYIEENSKQTIDFVMIINSINFAFTEFQEPHRKFEVKQPSMDFNWNGAFAMTYCIKRAMPEIFDAKYLANMTTKEAKKIFQGETIQIPMLKERIKILQEAGTVLDEMYEGHFYNLVEDSNYHAFKDGNGVVEKLVKDFPSYNDISYYKGKEVKFYKRAQLAVGVLYARLKGTSLFDIKDIDDLTVYADYVLPVSLTRLGVMKKTEELENKIQNWKEIKKDSLEELEIRTHTIYGADLLIKEVNKYRPEDKKINALHMDYKLWSETRKPALKGYKHQLVRTISN